MLTSTVTVLSVAGTVRLAFIRGRTTSDHIAHAVMASVMAATLLWPEVAVLTGALAALAGTAVALSRELGKPWAVRCLLDVVAMLILTTVMMVGCMLPSTAPTGHSTLTAALGVQAAIGWAAAAVWLHYRPAALHRRGVELATVKSTQQPGTIRAGQFRVWSLATALASAAAMATMVATH